MRKLIPFFIAALATLVLPVHVFAASPSLDIRIEQPKSPTNVNNLKVNFVALDRLGRSITVDCFKKGPTDGGFSQFGSTITLASGGNQSNCEPSTVLSQEGTYAFYAVATAGSDTDTSPTVSVDYKTSGPGTPTNYSKENPSSCTYKIKFRTADDGGKTIRVDLYRSDSTSFTADEAHRVELRFIGSNTDGEILNTVPDCAKTYYYVLRAFDSANNGSGVVGDSIVNVNTTTTTTTTTTNTTTTTTGSTTNTSGGAIASGTTGGNVLGGETGTKTEEGTPTETGAPGSVLGESTPSAETVTPTPESTGTNAGKLAPWLLIPGIGILVLAWTLRKKKPTSPIDSTDLPS